MFTGMGIGDLLSAANATGMLEVVLLQYLTVKAAASVSTTTFDELRSRMRLSFR